MIGQGELRTPHASRLTPLASRRAGTRTKTICPPWDIMRKNCFLKKKNLTPPPPPRNFVDTIFFLNVGNSMKSEENMKF